MRSVDVAILGGGLAGNLLARQLRRALPDVSISVFERSHERAYKVGESTVEIATNYLTRRQGLSTYIYKEHLPKNGLRFFFDSEKRDAALPEMSEIGVHSLPPYPSFQLDRSRLERDLLEMNRESQIDVRVGARVKNLTLDAEGKHRFEVVQEGESSEWQARWVVDATGREGTVAKLRELRRPEKNHRIAAAWGRARNVTDMDAIDAPEWHARARHTSRVLSTNHFCYPGYWIWFIPLREGLTSLGIVSESGRWDPARHKPEGFLSFLREHAAPASLLENAELIDLDAFTQLAFRTTQYFSGERWAVVGDAAAFTDPFYSPGSDFIALENDFVADLIVRDLGGEDIAERAKTYDAFMHFRFDTTMAIYEGLYPTFGSFELFRAKVFFDTACYYNLLFDAYAKDDHLDLRWLRTNLRRRSWAMATMENFGTLFRRAAEEMQKRGTYFRENLGHHELEGRDAFGVMEVVGAPRTRREVNARSEEIFQRTQAMVAAALDGESTIGDAIADGSRELYDAWTQLDAPGGA